MPRGGSARSAVRFLVVMVRGRVVLARYRRSLLRWWQAQVQPGSTTDVAEATEAFREAARYNLLVMRSHSHVSWVGQSLLERLKGKCALAGLPGLERELIASEDDYEQALIADMWAVSRDTRTLAAFLVRWGFQGPVVGELSSHSWREDPTPLLPIIEAYRAKPDGEAPATLQERRGSARRAAEQQLLAGRGLLDRMKTRVLIRQARTYIPLRQAGRSTFLKTYDVARCMARRIGAHRRRRGTRGRRRHLPCSPSRTARRRAAGRGASWWRSAERRAFTRRCSCPSVDRADRRHVTVVTALHGERPTRSRSSRVGVAEGDRHHHPRRRNLALRHPVRPPTPAAAAAVTTDVGAQMSHGAIVARELGIPAVVNTRVATQHLRTGDRIRVDGRPAVELLSPTPNDHAAPTDHAAPGEETR
jgi:pyruvate,water dikinase